MADYELTINLLDKTAPAPTIVLDLVPFFAKVDATHTGVQKTNNALLTLYIPPDGKFVRTAPFLMDENTKFNFMIEIAIDQGANKGHVFRCEIGQPTAKSDKDLGEILEIPLVCQEFVTKEHFDSLQDIFVAPNDHFKNIIDTYNQTAGVGNGGVFLSPSNLNLPNQDVLKQNWLPLAPTKTGRLMEEVIERLAESPTTGGVLLDFYFDFLPDPLVLRNSNVKAEEFGIVNSGVDINPLTVGQVGAESGNTFNLDNIVFKNLVILKCDPNCGSLPTNHQEFASQYNHALQRPVWSPTITYNEGDVVQVVVAGFPNQRFFTSLMDSNIGNNPLTFPGTWDEDFTIDSTDTPLFFTATPYTSNIDDVKANLAGKANIPGGGFQGYMADWNITRFNFDREIPDDRFERISFKMIDDRANSPPFPGSTVWTGKRFIVGIAGSTDGQMGGDFVGQRTRIAEAFVDPVSGFITYTFSDLPIDTGTGDDRQQDMVNNWEDATVLAYDDSANGGAGDWVRQWDLVTGGDVDALKSAGSPFHLVKEFGLVTGATGIIGQAVGATFNWKQLGFIPPFESSSGNGGNNLNRSSRGAWLTFMYPMPREVTGNGNIGHLYGADRAFPFLDTFNLTRNADGQVGWNRGKASEGLGSISSVSFKLKLGVFLSVDDSQRLNGFADEPMVFWAIDRNDRIFFQDFTQRVNNAWEAHTIPVGPRAPQSLYNSRIDELVEVFDHILPNFDFFLTQREFNGILFDWRFLKGFGVFMKNSYDAQGLYTGAYDEWTKQVGQAGEQLGHNVLEFFDNLLKGDPQTFSTDSVVDHTKIAMDELHFDKELYATSNDTILTATPRVILERDESIDDYLDAKAKAQAIDARKQFFPQFWFITARGDVRLKLGQKFTITGPRVPNGTLDLVCSQVKHRIDTDGYFMEIVVVRKFVLP